VLINNAGVSALGAVEELPLESFKKDMEPITWNRTMYKSCSSGNAEERGKGTIINISSVAGKVYSNFHGTYAPSKAAVKALSECLANTYHITRINPTSKASIPN
jgi:short-subunit dehydrogenase